MSKRHAREHGRILSVDEETLGSVLVADAASGATTLTVDDAAEFEDDGTGGWLSVNDQVIEYDTVDDDAGTIHLKTALSAAADDGDPVYVWSKLYATPATVKTALVMVDGEDDNTDPVHATLAEAVQDIPEGLRGEAGESCTLVRVSDDEWEVTAVGGRPTSAKRIKFEADDVHTITASEVAAGVATIRLSHRPEDEAVVAFWGRVPQQPTEYTVNYDAKTITWPLEGFEQAGQVLWVHYAYLRGLANPAVGFEADGWRYLIVSETDSVDRSGVALDDSSWSTGQGAFGNVVAQDGTTFHSPAGWPAPNTVVDPNVNIGMWVRRSMSEAPAGAPLTLRVRVDGDATIFWNGTQIATRSANGTVDVDSIDVPTSARGGSDLLAIHLVDDASDPTFDFIYIDARIEW